jgi:GcrA cell cycle regulator
MSWTDERTELLKRRWSDGMSASEIAGELGGLTRNAIIGKVHRLGLPGRARSTSTGGPRPRKSRPRASNATLNFGKVKSLREPTALKLALQQELPEAEVIVLHRRTFLELASDKCHWPIGDPSASDFAFCGNEACPGFSYCVGHARMAYRVPSRYERGLERARA